MTVVVFDFDQTLTQKHLFTALYDPSSRPVAFRTYTRDKLFAEPKFLVDYIFGGKERLIWLITALDLLSSEYESHLVISSHGFVLDIIDTFKALYRMGYEINETRFEFIHGVIPKEDSQKIPTFSDYNKDKKWAVYETHPFINRFVDMAAGNKFQFITDFLSKKRGFDRCIIFADDSSDYFAELAKTGDSRFITIPVGKNGLHDREMTAIVEHARSPACKTHYTADELAKLLPPMKAAIAILSACISCQKNQATDLCGDCLQARYCSESCQQAHWGTHALKCNRRF